MSKIIVLAEQHEGELVKASLNAIGAAQSLAEMVGGGFDIALAGQGLDGAVSALQGYGAGTIYQIESEALAGYTAQAYAQAFHQAVKASEASFVLSASTAKGKDCTPRVTARLEAGQASDVSAIEDQGGTILYTRPMWAGNIIGKVKINSDIQVATIRPTDFELATHGGSESSVERISPTIEGVRMRYISLDSVKSDRPALADADVVVAGGRGLKEADNFEKVLAPLADKLDAAIGASRAVVDSGWVPNDWQVGQTGKVVAPKLYIAMGISGAIQHVAGMKGSKTIVAINKDPEAPIFQIADYGLVADLFDAIPELTGKI